MLAAGATPEQIEEFRRNDWATRPDGQEHTADGHFEVLPENWEAVRLFQLCATQWRYLPAGGSEHCRPIGIDFASLHAAMLMLCIPAKDQEDHLHRVRAIERGACRNL